MATPDLAIVLNEIRALGEETRLRIVIALARGELTVTELTHILQQSQPRVSRHVKILADAGILDRHREGAWVFYRLNQQGEVIAGLEDTLIALGGSQETTIRADLDRLGEVHDARAEAAAAFFAENADSWERLRAMHLPESDIEETMRQMVGSERVDRLADLGTGTGQMLIVFRDLYREATGYDVSREMLAIARTRLAEAGVEGAHVRQSDLYEIERESPGADLVSIHQVLHYLSDPAKAIGVARRLLSPGGRILIADFAAHDLEFLREEFAHRRLGFSDAEVAGWAKGAGLTLAATETLEPRADETNTLTVKLWLLADAEAVPARIQKQEVENV